MSELSSPSLVTVQRIRDPHLARLAHSFLESEGIPSYLQFEYHVLLYWVISDAIGGIRLQVSTEHEAHAMDLLGEDRSDELDKVEETSLELSSTDLCPHCGSADLRADRLERMTKSISLILHIPFAVGRNFWVCNHCGHSFRIPHPESSFRTILLTHPPALIWSVSDSIIQWSRMNRVARLLLYALGRNARACWSCGAALKSDDRICPGCGIPLPDPSVYEKHVRPRKHYDGSCPRCHVPYRYDDYTAGISIRRCSGCGAALPLPPPGSMPPSPERK